MKHLLVRSLAAHACFGIFGLPQTSAAPEPDPSNKPDFSGTWVLDLKASTSLDPLMERIGATLSNENPPARPSLKPPSSRPNRLSQSLPAAQATSP